MTEWSNNLTEEAEAEPQGHGESVGQAHMIHTSYGDDCEDHHKQCTLIYENFHCVHRSTTRLCTGSPFIKNSYKAAKGEYAGSIPWQLDFRYQ